MKNMLSLILSLASVVAGESAQWSSPHSLQAETEAPVALLPFPRVVKWGEAMLDLPPSPCWNIAPNSACAPIMQSDGGSMLSTACSRFLHSLPCPTLKGSSGHTFPFARRRACPPRRRRAGGIQARGECSGSEYLCAPAGGLIQCSSNAASARFAGTRSVAFL